MKKKEKERGISRQNEFMLTIFIPVNFIIFNFSLLESIFEPASSYFDDDLRYLRYCGGHSNAKTFTGEIRSPGYPSFYPKNVTCNWLLRVDPGKKIYIRVQYLELSPTMGLLFLS